MKMTQYLEQLFCQLLLPFWYSPALVSKILANTLYKSDVQDWWTILVILVLNIYWQRHNQLRHNIWQKCKGVVYSYWHTTITLFVIGFETAKALALYGAHVILACRDMNKANKAAATIRATQVCLKIITIIVPLVISDLILTSVDVCVGL